MSDELLKRLQGRIAPLLPSVSQEELNKLGEWAHDELMADASSIDPILDEEMKRFLVMIEALPILKKEQDGQV